MKHPAHHALKDALLFLLLLLTPHVALSQESTSESVIQLNSKNFDSSIRDGNVWLIEFYAPWCGHCVRFSPTYEAVAQKLHGMHKKSEREGDDKRKVMVAKIDGAAEQAISSRFSIRGFPDFYLVDGWTIRQYEGARSLDGLVQFATKSYLDVEPIPFLNSPFGPMGQLRALLMYVGTKVVEIFEFLLDKGLSHTVAGLLICSVGIVGGLFSIIAIGMLTLPKAKED